MLDHIQKQTNIVYKSYHTLTLYRTFIHTYIYTIRRFNLFSCTILCAGVFFVIWDYVRVVYVKAFRSNNKFRDFRVAESSTFDCCCKFNLVWWLMRINVNRELKGHISFVSNTICETSSLCMYTIWNTTHYPQPIQKKILWVYFSMYDGKYCLLLQTWCSLRD